MNPKSKIKEKFKTIRKRQIDGVAVSRLVRSRKTGKIYLTTNIDAVCNRIE